MNEIFRIAAILPFISAEWAEWSRCNSWCSKGMRNRLWFNNETQELTDKVPDLQESREECDGEDLFCALSLGLPGVFALLATLAIYTLCRKTSSGDLSRGHKALLSYRTVFGARKSKAKAEAAKKRKKPRKSKTPDSSSESSRLFA
ncbi:Oidioi.mRNA.OKI2018_I69.PAR.g12486.t1.cds [Oikopleura dioica]|uniref:Oidioi.mRNA.OKI2018_I69.PAR.g12486.t1.cds n=1 Tax=Oikopleura dioica TaxID=34765 RepID=A0ABN7S562_OIKDI|nr:Oidioi.mRNA.OKI2018_I69.PAR.g12486.t1.cds [Oikopleura dioica]